MKKSYIIGGIIGLAVVVGLGFLLKSKSPSINNGESAPTHTSEGASTVTEANGKVETPNSLTPTNKVAAHPAVGPNDPKMKKIDDFLVHSRVVDEFKAMDELLEAQLEQLQDASQLSSSDQEELDKLRKIINGEKLLADYKEAMYEKFSEPELEKLNEIYQNPAVARVKEAQVYNQTQEGQKELIEFWKTFKSDSLPADRLAGLKNYDHTTGGSENTVKMIQSVAKMASKGKDDPSMKKENEAFLKQVRPPVEEANLVQNAKNFKDQSVEQINETTKIVSAPEYQKAEQVKNGVFMGAMEQVGTEIQKSAKAEHNDSAKSEK